MTETQIGLLVIGVPTLLIGAILLGRYRPVFWMFVAALIIGLGYLTTTGAVEDVGKAAVTYIGVLPEETPAAVPAPVPATAPEAEAASEPAPAAQPEPASEAEPQHEAPAAETPAATPSEASPEAQPGASTPSEPAGP